MSVRRAWLVPALLVVLGVVPAVAGMARLAELAGGAPITPANARFMDAPLPVTLHILAVIPFSILGALQFAPALRRGGRRWHALAGRFLVACGLVTALSGLWMTVAYPWPVGDGVALYLMRLAVGVAMTASILAALDAVRRRDFAAHGAWMTRAYALGMGAGTQVLTHLPWFILVGQTDVVSRAVLMGAGWALNVWVAERVIRRSAARPAGRAALAQA
ncbi:MAG TPA: DUF2306 domain-containing protein [Gemmatimonadaceae bacterium]|nr:DUF2306 domain-containing protein [Gemmatimonadaceae bacterium]